jgi:hypothetical protein
LCYDGLYDLDIYVYVYFFFFWLNLNRKSSSFLHIHTHTHSLSVLFLPNDRTAKNDCICHCNTLVTKQVILVDLSQIDERRNMKEKRLWKRISITSDWIKLKNRKYMGQLTEQFIRVRAKPFIVEVDQQTNNTEQKMFV